MKPSRDLRIARSLLRGCAALAGLLLFAVATANAQPILIIDDGASFEGNPGTNPILKLPVHFSGAQPNTVTGFVSATPLSGTGFNPATGGAACGPAGVDFEQFANVPFSIPPNTPNGTLTVNIRICGDATIEPDEHIFVNLSGVTNATCLEGTCNAVATIVNDDGPPSMVINNISVSEPALGNRTVAFTVSLNHPSTQQVSVNFATRDGTAKSACSTSSPCTVVDFDRTSGTLTIPASTSTQTNLTGQINVVIHGDNIRENDETFFVDLSSPVNATIADGTGQATIHDTTLTIGSFDVTPDNETVMLDEYITYSVIWTVPEGRVWRDLTSVDFRIRGPHKPLWLRWDEAANTFSLCEKGGKHNDASDDDTEDDGPANGPGANVVCTPGGIPGTPGYLETSTARVNLLDSSVVGSGPTGRSVTLEIALELIGKAEGHKYNVDLAAADDFGNVDNFVHASKLSVLKSAKPSKPPTP